MRETLPTLRAHTEASVGFNRTCLVPVRGCADVALTQGIANTQDHSLRSPGNVLIMRTIISCGLLLQAIRKDFSGVNHQFAFPGVNESVTSVNESLTMTQFGRGREMFRYYHSPRRFGLRQPVAATNLAGDLRFFLGAYLAGTAFALAYLF